MYTLASNNNFILELSAVLHEEFKRNIHYFDIKKIHGKHLLIVLYCTFESENFVESLS